MNPIANMIGSMMPGNNGGMNPLQMIGQIMSGRGNPMQLVQWAVQNNPQLGPVVNAFQSGNNAQAFSELAKINPQFANSVQGKNPQQLQQMAGQALQGIVGQGGA